MKAEQKKLGARLDRAESAQRDVDGEVLRLRKGIGRGAGRPQSLGQAVVQHDAFKAMQSQGLRGVKMTITSAEGSPAAGSAGALVIPHREAEPVPMPRRRL